MSGKGSRPRPLSVPQETFADRWDRIFDRVWNHEYPPTPVRVEWPQETADPEVGTGKVIIDGAGETWIKRPDGSFHRSDCKSLGCRSCGLPQPKIGRFRTTMNRVVDIHRPAAPEIPRCLSCGSNLLEPVIHFPGCKAADPETKEEGA